MTDGSLFGIETEYALTGVRSVEDAAVGLMSIARDKLTWLQGGSFADLFLSNGSRLYIDCGSHPEVATPECACPDDIVRYVRAGDATLESLAVAYRQLHPSSNLAIQRCNVDYASGATWGVHESYLCVRPPRALQSDLVPHLVTRTLYTGAGGYDPRYPGLRFVLSPRSLLFRRTGSLDSTGDRGIFHLRDEDHCERGHHRLHVILGESLCAARALRLKVGATALVVAMADAGVAPGASVLLETPIAALRAVSRDPTLRVSLPLIGGGRAMALEIQRRYLEQAERHVGETFMPPWAADICAEWRRTLDALEEDLPVTEWQLKRALYLRRGEARGYDAASIHLWSRRVALAADQARVPTVPRCARSLARLLGEGPGLEDVVPAGEAPGFRQFLAFRREMFEVDVRFGQIGEGGVCEALAGCGGMEMHAAPATDGRGDPRDSPPPDTRARVRGAVVARNSRNTDVICTWDHVLDRRSGRWLDLSRPFESEERWSEPREPHGARPERQRIRSRPSSLPDLFTQMPWGDPNP